MNWHTRRRLIYALAVLLTVSAVTVYVLRDTLFPEPSCFDNRQNGFEVGVDCGGTCSLRCTQEVIPLTTKWSRALRTSSGTYDLVAMVSNKNINNAPRSLAYVFTAYDAEGAVLKQLFGTSTAPIDGDFPVIIQNVQLSQMPASVSAQLFDGPHFTVQEKPTSPTLRTSGIRYEAGVIPRVYAILTNTRRITIENLRVRVLVYDANDNVYAAGETLIPFLDKEESKNISYTWNAPFKEYPTKIRIFPIFDPFTPAL